MHKYLGVLCSHTLGASSIAMMDFELDDPFPPVTLNKRKNVIGLDDLFNDHKKEQETIRKKKPKASKKNCESDDDDALEAETKLTETFQNFQQTLKEVDGQEIKLTEHLNKDMTSSWGLEVFGAQRTSSSSLVTEVESSSLLQNLLDGEVSALLEHTEQTGESFLKGLLLNGWLSKLILNRCHLEESVAKWALNLSLYSPAESVMTSACDFWCTVLLGDKVHTCPTKIEWLPNYLELKEALGSFGYQLDSPYNILPTVHDQESSKSCLHPQGPPANIRVWIKLVGACCRVRSRYSIFSALEAQELVATIVCLFLEKNLLGLSSELHDCLGYAIHYFEEKEWDSSCDKATDTIAVRIPRDLNCLRAMECISGVDTRSKQLRSVLAFQMLKSCFTEISDVNDVLKFLLSKNLKDKSCDLFKMYIYFVLTENWLLFSAELGPIDKELWNGIIRKCSSQISNTDFRPCAQEIRNRASYLMQNTNKD